MNWRSRRFFIPLLIVCILLVIGIVFAAILTRSTQTRSISDISTASIPTPDSARTTYTNTQFAYSIRYPTQWHLNTSSDKSQIRVFLTDNPAAPEAVAFDISCFANPNQLNAQSLWQQRRPQDKSETGVGIITFSNGVPGYIAKGQGQTAYTVYTLVKQRVACQIVTYQTDPLNAKVITDVVNSFRW